jgi:hypothetical protein
MTITLESNSVTKRRQITQQIKISHVEGSKNCDVNYLHNGCLNDRFSMQMEQIDTVFLDRVKLEMLKNLGVEQDVKNDDSSEKNSEENSPESESDSFIKKVHSDTGIVDVDLLDVGPAEQEFKVSLTTDSLQTENPNREYAKIEDTNKPEKSQPEDLVKTFLENIKSEPIHSEPTNLVKPVSSKPTSSNTENPDQTNSSFKQESSNQTVQPTQLNSNNPSKQNKSWSIDVKEAHIDSAKKLIKAITRNREKFEGKRFEYEFTGDPHWHQRKKQHHYDKRRAVYDSQF